MSLRKAAALLAAFGLAIGLIGSGVGAAFVDQVTANQTINVGTFSCTITDATAGATIAPDQKSVSYTAPTINSSAPGSAPFRFQVRNGGSIDALLKVTASPALTAPWSYIGMPIAAVPLAAGGSHDYNTGVQWTELSNADLGATGTVTWTVSCGELPAAASLPANTWVAASTNAQNIANGWATVSALPGSGSVSLTFTQPRNFYACFEWRTDGNVPEQRLQADQVTVGPPFVDHFLKSQGINDGLYKFVCLKASQTTVVVPVLHYVEVRMAFGAESDERFDWTRFDALP